MGFGLGVNWYPVPQLTTPAVLQVVDTLDLQKMETPELVVLHYKQQSEERVSDTRVVVFHRVYPYFSSLVQSLLLPGTAVEPRYNGSLSLSARIPVNRGITVPTFSGRKEHGSWSHRPEVVTQGETRRQGNSLCQT